MKSHIVIPWLLTTLDWVVFGAVLLLTLGAISYGHALKKKPQSERENWLELLLMGRTLTLPMFVATLVATWYGGLIGVTAIAFDKGIYSFLIQGVFWYITYIIFALWVLDRVRSHSAATLAELAGQIFGPRAQKVTAIFNFFNVVPIVYTISIGVFLQMVLNVSLPFGMAMGIFLVVSYSMYGGLRSVVYSDLIQFVVMCLSVLLVALFSLWEFGGPVFLVDHLEPSYFDLSGGNSLGTTIAWGLIALSTLVDPNFYQRSFAAKSQKTAKKGILISTVIWLLFDLCTTAGALYAKTQIPHAPPNQAYITFSLQVLPVGLRGFFLAGVLATILSTLDSYLFIAGTSLSYDLVPKKYRHPFLYPLTVLMVGLLSLGLALVFDGDIKMVWKTLGSYSAACLLLPVLVGLWLPGKISDKQFITTCGIGVLATTFWRLSPPGGLGWVDEIYAGLASTSLVIGLALCYNGRHRR